MYISAQVPQYQQQHHTPATVPHYCVNQSYKNQNNSIPVQRHKSSKHLML